MRFQKILSCLGRNIAKGPFAVATEKLGHLLKALRRAVFVPFHHDFRIAVNMAVGDKDIQIAVPVSIQETSAPANLVPAGGVHTGSGTDIGKEVFAVVAKERPALVKKGGDEDIRSAIAGDIVGLDSHAAHGVALPVDGRPAPNPARLQLTVAQIAILKIGHFIVADKDVRLAVAVAIEHDHAEGFAYGLQPGRDAPDGER